MVVLQQALRRIAGGYQQNNVGVWQLANWIDCTWMRLSREANLLFPFITLSLLSLFHHLGLRLLPRCTIDKPFHSPSAACCAVLLTTTPISFGLPWFFFKVFFSFAYLTCFKPYAGRSYRS